MQQHLLDERAKRTARESELMRVVEMALRIGRRAMRAYAHDNSPKVFTQPQVLACLILKRCLGKVTGRQSSTDSAIASSKR